MSHTTGLNTDAVPICHRDRTKTLLAASIEHHLTGYGQPPDETGHGPWDVWWACYRAQRTATDLGLDPRRTADHCQDCATDAGSLTFRRAGHRVRAPRETFGSGQGQEDQDRYPPPPRCRRHAA